MAITKHPGRQAPSVAIVDFTYEDLVSGTFDPCIAGSGGEEVIGGSIIITEPFNSSVSDTLTVGDTGDTDRYKGSVDGQAEALTALVPTGHALTPSQNFGIMWTGVGNAPTAGAGRVVLETINARREDFSQD
jgi:hypothetical protein